MVSMSAPEVIVRVLGPVDVMANDDVLQVGGRHARMLLAALVVGANHMVSSDSLAYVLWGDDPPPSRDNTLQSYVSRLRHLLGHEAISSEDHSYQLQVTRENLDALRFESLVADAEEARSQPEKCRAFCREALALWRGTPFGEFADQDPFRLEALRLDELRVFTMQLKLECDLSLGHHEMVVGTLEALVEENPYNEHAWYMLIEALSRSGRRVEALRGFQRLRGILAEVGLEPTIDLRDLEEGIVLEKTEVRPRLRSV
jgi:DNA-binding SARP family transcriptional activator